MAPGIAQTLTSLLGKDVTAALADVSNADPASIAGSLEGSYAFSTLKGGGGVDGNGLLLVKEKDASIISDLLIGQDGTSAPPQMTELHFSAYGEVVQQLADVCAGEAKKSVGSKASWGVMETVSLEASAASNRLSQLGKSLVLFSFNVSVQDLLSSDFLFCLPDAVASRLTGEGKPAASAPTGNFQTGVSNANTQMQSGGRVMQQFENEFSGSSRPSGGNIGLLMDVPLKLTVELGRTTKLVKEILALAPGSVVELDKLAGEPVDILVNEKLIAKGEVVVIDENFGVRITEIINPEERLSAVQA